MVEKTAAELALENATRLNEIELLVRGALAHSEEFAMAYRNAPDRDAWIAYRQALLDLSKLSDADAMVDAWPLRPDGIDAIEGVRARSVAARAAVSQGD
ncbi:hypothetical protein [Bradyrhizobium sp. NAS80.1]|uniref:hypothetical protein n=1 Tax=Bradyrhizobium sp. NAS80.1 TaxID=1680159 RepID=UPI00143D6B94|nr:hypothetical protein [Bradyrhizobium sp. NAS80.1]